MAQWIWDLVAESILPARCPVCHRGLPGASPGGVCLGCWASFNPLAPPFCSRCSLPFPVDLTEGIPDSGERTVGVAAGAVDQAEGNEPPCPALEDLCAGCQTRPPPFLAARALAAYEGTAREILHAFKFRSQPELAWPLAKLMAARWRAEPPLAGSGALVVCVPQRLWKKRRRGFNPAELLARALARETGLPLARGALRKNRWTPDQAKLSSMQQRAENVNGAFAARRRKAARFAGRRMVLVDDIMTTGATASECARVLLEAGALDVVVLAAARTPRIVGGS